MVVSMAAVRRLAVERQFLGAERPGGGVDGILEVTRRLRVLQVDPISVVAPSHQLVLWSRMGAYSLEDLDEVLWQRKALFSYWGHAASLVLTEDFPLHRHRMIPYRSQHEPRHQRVADWMEENAALRRLVLGNIRRQGPLRSREIDPEVAHGWSSSGWNNERNVGRMLDFLWIEGELTIAGRAGLERVWDLRRRWMPPGTPTKRMAPDRAAAISAEFALRALGVARFKEIKVHFICGLFAQLPAVVDAMVRRGVLRKVAVHGDDGANVTGPWYVHRDDLERLRELDVQPVPGRTVVLSPFDNLVRDRDRTEAIWGFRYRTQFYIPKVKRDHGFYVMPVLHGDRLVARVDPRFDRERRVLVVEVVTAEDGTDPGWAAALAPTLRDLSSFLGGGAVELGAGVSSNWREIAD
ncbi:MAG: winged helix-turn-helix domain-containing protein [Candidatus Dormibacteria bacterium]